MSNKQQRGGIVKRWVAELRSKWKLQDEISELRFQLQLKDLEIRDLDNRLEAYKDALVALSRGYRLVGMMNELDLQRISKRKDGVVRTDVDKSQIQQG